MNGACDLCGLEVGARPFPLRARGQTLEFCCEGCRGIYQMLHEINETETEVPDANALKLQQGHGK